MNGDGGIVDHGAGVIHRDEAASSDDQVYGPFECWLVWLGVHRVIPLPASVMTVKSTSFSMSGKLVRPPARAAA